MSNYIVDGSDLTSVANAIRAKSGGSSQLAFPAGFVSEIGAIQTGALSWNELATGVFPNNTDVIVTATTARKYAFAKTTGIRSVTANNIQSLNASSGDYLFDSSSLQTLVMENLNSVAGTHYIFANCKSLSSVKLPLLRDAGDHAFENDSALIVVALPSMIGTYRSFVNCTSLEAVDYGGIGSGTINVQNFSGCQNLTTLVLRNTNITALANINAFNNTPFASGGAGGTIYIPKALHDHLGDNSSSDYKHASNWSTIEGYGTITWAKIEGSQYEHYYADGTEIPE